MRHCGLLLLSVLAIGCGYGDTTSVPEAAPNTVDAVGVTSWSPATITIKVGDAVKFRNTSSTSHNVTFDQTVAGHPDNVGNFASSTQAVTFATAGTFPYHCGIHAVMQGTVVVQP